MKSYTSIEQAKKMSEYLSLESADMFHAVDAEIVVTTPYITYLNGERNIPAYKGAIPCWSLAALLSVLDFPSLNQNKEDEWEVCVPNHNSDGYIEVSADNPVDACYEMITKLHDLYHVTI